MEWDFRVKASTDLEAKRIARNMAIEALRKKNMIGRWFEVQNVEWLQKSLFGDGVLAKVHVYVKDNKIMKNAKVKSYLAQEFRDLKARLSKKNFNDQKSKWIAGLASIKDALKNFKDGRISHRETIGAYEIKIWEYEKDYPRYGGKYSYHISRYDGATDLASGICNSEQEAISEAKRKVKQFMNHDSAIKDEIVRRVDYRGCHIYIGKQGNYTYSVYTKNSMGRPLAWDTGYGSESEALEAAKKSADLIVQKFGDSAEYINDRKIDIKKDGKLIDTVNAESLDEAVRIYERQHPELRGQIDAYFSDAKVEDDIDLFEELEEQFHKGVDSKHLMLSFLMNKYGIPASKAMITVNAFVQEAKNAGLKIKDSVVNDIKVVTREEWNKTPNDYKTIINGKKYMMYIDPQSHMTVLGPVEVKDAVIKDFISYDKDWAERMFKAGYSARETAMRIEAYTSSTNHSEQADLINRLEKQRKEWFERQLEEKRAGRR